MVKLAKALLLALAVTAAALITFSAAASSSKTLHFKLVAATASATLTFHTADTISDETTDGSVVLKASPKARGAGTLPGRVMSALRGKVSEKVTTQHNVSTSPYEETCSKVRKVAGRGGVILKRVGSRVEVRWSFPQAKPSFCQGPEVGGRLTARMKRFYPAKVFSRKHLTIVLSGSAKVPGETSTVSYRWHAVLKLARG